MDASPLQPDSTAIASGPSSELDEQLDVPHPFLRVSDPKKRAYLIAQSTTPVKTLACKIAGISTRTIWNWETKARNNPDDPESKAFIESMEIARKLAIGAAEDEAWERAVHGWKEPVFGQISEPVEIPTAKGDGTRIVWRHRTGIVGEMPKKSDTMLIFMLKGHKPETYRDNVHVSGSMGIVLRVSLPDNGRPRLLPSGDAPV